MSLKSKLSITLKADDVVVAEAEDTKLWLKILTSIIENTGTTPSGGGSLGDQHSHEHQHGVSA